MSFVKLNGKSWVHAALMLFASIMLITAPSGAQANTVDLNDVTDSELGAPPPANTSVMGSSPSEGTQNGLYADGHSTPVTTESQNLAAQSDYTYQAEDLIGAAEGVFGKGAQGLGKLIEDILKKQGRPNSYIIGREGGGAFIFGLRYGSGILIHKVEGEKPVYWTGPSIGPDAGANAGSTFILVYNLYDTEEIYGKFPAAEGAAYLGGGFSATYLRRGGLVVIPVRVGAGLRLGANVGYMRFSKVQRWLPF